MCQPLGSRERAEGTVAPAVDRVERRLGLRHGDHADEESLALADVQLNRVSTIGLVLQKILPPTRGRPAGGRDDDGGRRVGTLDDGGPCAVASRSKTGRGLVTAPIFLLAPQVKLRKRLDLARDAERAIDTVPGRIVAGWVEGRF